MLLQTVQHNVQRHGLGEETEFQFAMSAKAARAFSDTLYADKIGSMVRETSCNASDSHTAAGYPTVPFTIHLPSELEPYYSVKDTGVGLDDHGVRTVFSSYFVSTKDNSNDEIGGFGLGSKTPFAYTDAFTITAIKNGVRRTYTSFFAANGKPTVAALGDAEATDEPNGVEVFIPVVETDDFSKFKYAVEQQLRFFAVKPRIVNGTVEWPEIKLSNIAPGLSLVENASYNNRKLFVVQGGVGYPLEPSKLSAHISKENNALLSFLAETGAVLEFPIGKIEVITSREAISYSPFTIANIDAMLTASRGVVKGNMMANVKKIGTEWERALFFNANGQYGSMLAADDTAILQKLVPNMVHCEYHARNTSWGLSLSGATKADPDFARIEKWTRRWYRGKYIVSMSENSVGAVKAAAGLTFIIRDTDDKPIIRLRHHVEQSQAREIFVINPEDGMLSNIIAKLDGLGVTYTLLSTLVAPPRSAVQTSSTYTKPSCYMWSQGKSKDYVNDWKRVVTKLADMTDGGLYIVIPEGERFNANAIPYGQTFIYDMVAEDKFGKEIFAIRERDLKRIANNPDWVPLADFAASISEQYINNVALIRASAINGMKDRSSFAAIASALTDAMVAVDAELPEEFVKLVHFNLLLERLRAPLDKYDAFAARIVANNCSNAIAKATVKLDTIYGNLVDAVNEKYMLLAHAPTTWDRIKGEYTLDTAVIPHLVKYVQLMGNVA